MIDIVKADKLIRNKFGSENIRFVQANKDEVTIGFYNEEDALKFYDDLQELENSRMSLIRKKGFLEEYWRVTVTENRFRIYQKQEEEKWLRMK